MANVQTPMDKAKVDELQAFAQKHLGIEVSGNMTKAQLIAQIKQAWPHSYILTEDPEAPNEIAPSRPTVNYDPTATMKPGTVRLIIQIVDEPGGEDPVKVGVNGRVMLVPRGEEVDIPERYYEVIRNATRHIYDPMRDGGINPVPRKVSAYPHQIIAHRPAEEVAA